MFKKKKSHRYAYQKHVHKRLLSQLVIFAVIGVVMFGIVAYDIWTAIITIPLSILGIGIGVGAGFIVGKFYRIRWHEETQKVVTGLDRFGVIVIIIYIGFSIFRSQIFGKFVHGPALTAIGFASAGGVMMGRFAAIADNINKVLKKQKIL